MTKPDKRRRATKREIEFGALAEHIDAYCEKTGKRFSDVVRTAVAKAIGAKEILATLPAPGRPRVNPEKEP